MEITVNTRKLIGEDLPKPTYEQKSLMKKLLNDEIAGLAPIITVEEAAKIMGYKRLYIQIWLRSFNVGSEVVHTRSIVDFFSSDAAFQIIAKSRRHQRLIDKVMKQA